MTNKSRYYKLLISTNGKVDPKRRIFTSFTAACDYSLKFEDELLKLFIDMRREITATRDAHRSSMITYLDQEVLSMDITPTSKAHSIERPNPIQSECLFHSEYKDPIYKLVAEIDETLKDNPKLKPPLIVMPGYESPTDLYEIRVVTGDYRFNMYSDTQNNSKHLINVIFRYFNSADHIKNVYFSNGRDDILGMDADDNICIKVSCRQVRLNKNTEELVEDIFVNRIKRAIKGMEFQGMSF